MSTLLYMLQFNVFMLFFSLNRNKILTYPQAILEPLSLPQKPPTDLDALYLFFLCPREESNLDQRVRSALFYPLNYEDLWLTL